MMSRRIFALFFTVLLAIPVVAGNAQTPAAGGTPAGDELAGLQTAVMRTYMPAGTFVGSATISLDGATPAASGADVPTLRSIHVVVREFDTGEHAASAVDQVSAEAGGLLPDAFQGGTQEITSEDLPGVGSQARLIRMDYTGQGAAVWLEYVIVQRDQYVLFISAEGSLPPLGMPGNDQVDKSLPTVAIAKAIVNGEPSPDEPILREDGTSTGGLWGFMPPPDSPLLMGLEPVSDSIISPNPGA